MSVILTEKQIKSFEDNLKRAMQVGLMKNTNEEIVINLNSLEKLLKGEEKMTNTIKTKVVLHSPHVTMERNGDCIDLNFCGLDKCFKNSDLKTLIGYEKEGYYNDEVYQYGNYYDEETQTYHYGKGSIFRVKLGFSMEIPEGKRANVYQRSGTRKNFGVLLTNHVGIIDNAYNGTDDQWMAEFYAIEDGQMKLGDRILQFEIVDVMPKVEFEVVESFDNENRGGFSSTGI